MVHSQFLTADLRLASFLLMRCVFFTNTLFNQKEVALHFIPYFRGAVLTAPVSSPLAPPSLSTLVFWYQAFYPE